MIDMSSLNVPGGVLAAGLFWAGASAFVTGPLVAERTIAGSGWAAFCERQVTASIEQLSPQRQPQVDLSCRQIMSMMGPEMAQLCGQGGDALFDLLTLDPLAAQKEQARQRELERLASIAEQAPSRCSCASGVVVADRVTWGLYAGSARLFGGPDDLRADLSAALQSPRCASLSAPLVGREASQ